MMNAKEMAAWRLQYLRLIEFRREIGHRWPSPAEQFPRGNKLGAWCARQNRMFRQNRLPANFARMLLLCGFPLRLGRSPWEPEQEARLRKRDKYLELFLWRLEHLRKFRKQHPRRWPRRDECFPGSHALGKWLGRMCKEYRRKKLPAHKAILLERMGAPLQGPFAQQWEEQFAQFKALLAEHPQEWRKTVAGRRLYQWVARQRTMVLRGELPPDQAKRLEGLGEGFPAQDRWGDGFEHLAAYRKLHPDRWPAGRDRSPDGYYLGTWCTNQRRRYRLGKLDHEQVRKLKDLGFPFRAWLQEAKWTNQYDHLVAFRALEPECWPENTEEFPPGNLLGKWCAQQRMDRQRGRLPARRFELLDRIGFPWETVKAIQWMERFGDLKDWLGRHADRWPKNHAVDPEEKSLAAWVTHQKQMWKQGRLPEKRLRLLRDLGTGW